ncbi:MAG TPA: CAP domain-containing protein [Acidimicrobiales bacterium]
MGRGASAIAAVVAVAFAVLVATATPAGAAAPPDHSAAARLLVLINQERVAHGLAPLGVNAVAVEVAQSWSAHMSDTDTLAHNNGWFTPASKQRAGASFVGENVAFNPDLEDSHRRLMNSPGHRANILSTRFHQVGIAAVLGPTGWWVTQDFVQLAAVAPAPPPTTAAPAPAPAPAPVKPAPVKPPAPPTTTPPTTAAPTTTAAPPPPEPAPVPETARDAGASTATPSELGEVVEAASVASGASGAEDSGNGEELASGVRPHPRDADTSRTGPYLAWIVACALFGATAVRLRRMTRRRESQPS